MHAIPAADERGHFLVALQGGLDGLYVGAERWRQSESESGDPEVVELVWERHFPAGRQG